MLSTEIFGDIQHLGIEVTLPVEFQFFVGSGGFDDFLRLHDHVIIQSRALELRYNTKYQTHEILIFPEG